MIFWPCWKYKPRRKLDCRSFKFLYQFNFRMSVQPGSALYYRRTVFEHNQLHCWLSPVHVTGLGDICFLIMDGLIYVVNQDDSHMDFLSLLSSIRSQGSKTLTLSSQHSGIKHSLKVSVMNRTTCIYWINKLQRMSFCGMSLKQKLYKHCFLRQFVLFSY